jgi:hypothetical protein
LSSFNAWYAGRVSPLPPDLRRALDPYDVVTGPRDLGGELALVVRVGAVDVELALRGVSATASAATTIGGVYLDLDRALAPPDHLRSNDPAYARWLVVDARGLIDPLLADGGRARLQLGRWRVEHPSPGSLRRVLELTARLALAPRHLAERWAALASALGGAWAGTWGTRGETRFVVGTGATALAIEARLGDDGLAVTRLAGERGALEVPLTLAPAEVVAIAGRLGVALTVRAAGPTAIAPLPIASWPSARGGDGGRGPRERTTTGADARPGLDERLVIDGVEVATRCAADLRAATAIAAEAPGARAAAGHRPPRLPLLAQPVHPRAAPGRRRLRRPLRPRGERSGVGPLVARPRRARRDQRDLRSRGGRAFRLRPRGRPRRLPRRGRAEPPLHRRRSPGRGLPRRSGRPRDPRVARARGGARRRPPPARASRSTAGWRSAPAAAR